MTTFIYSSSDNMLREKVSMEKPVLPDDDNWTVAASAEYHFEKLPAYNAHISSLRTISCDESCRGVFKDKGEYEEGKDYKMVLHYHAPDEKELLAVPLSPAVQEDETKLWYEVKDLMLEAMEKNMPPEEWVSMMKGLYHITKKPTP